MNYPFTDADWLRQALPKTNLYRRVSVGLLTLGHLRTAEALGVGFVAGREASVMDWGLLLSIAQFDWRKALKRCSKPNFWWIWRRDRNTPRTAEEIDACVKWLRGQNYYPTRTLVTASEQESIDAKSQFSVNRASTALERLALTVCRIAGWQSMTICDCVWDVPMLTATHLIVTNNELDGAYHVPYDMIRKALNNGEG
jgi:hypothetical protein